MSLIRSARNFFRKSRSERAYAFRNRWRVGLSSLLFGPLGRWVNRPGSSYLLVARPDFDYDYGLFPEFGDFHRAWKAGAEGNNGSDLVRLFLLWENLSKLSRIGVLGDFVEVGVYKGNSAKILCHFARKDARHLFLFDTFSGFEQSDLTGVDHGGEPLFKDTSLSQVRAFVGTDGVVYVPGKFPESTTDAEKLPQRVAVLHIDCDLYAPTKAALEFFYPRISRGGLIIVHDYASTHWPGTTQAVDEFFADKSEHIIVMPDKCGTAMTCKI